MTLVFTMRCKVLFWCVCLTVAMAGQSSPNLPAQKQDSSKGSDSAEAPGSVSTPETINRAVNDDENRIGLPLLKHLALDQAAIWTSPSRIRLHDATWLVPLGGLAAGLLVTDQEFSRHLSNSPKTLSRYKSISDYGAYSLIGAAGGLFLWGHLTNNDREREAGILSGEAAIDSYALMSAVKYGTGRERPLMGSGEGSFYDHGTSFPSEHAAAAWSIASVLAHEYPGPLTQIVVYGLASLVSASRVRAKQHFSSDVLIGSAAGWLVGRYVYVKHHNTELRGGPWEDLGILPERGKNWAAKNMGSPYVPLDSWIYPVLDRMIALGFVHSGFLGMRPWTRLECSRLVSEAEDHVEPGAATETAAGLLNSLQQEFADEVRSLGGGENRRFEVDRLYSRFTNISGSPLRDGYHFGQTIVNDFGRPYAEGFNDVSGISAWASDGPFVGYIRAEYQHAPPAPALPLSARQAISLADFQLIPVPPATPVSQIDQFRLLDAYVGMTWENWEISFGKQSLWWGPGAGGPMLWSNNAEPVNMLRLNRVSPFILPGVLSWLGPMRFEVFLGQLEGHHFVEDPSGLIGSFNRTLDPQPIIHGQKVSFKPSPNFEFSLSRTTIFAGQGVPFNSHTLLKSLFSTSNGPPGSASDPGDRRSALDLTYRIPKLRDWLTFYIDGFVDDQISPLSSPDKTAWSAGLYMPKLPRIPQMDLRVEGVFTDTPIGGTVGHGFFYFNLRYLNGYTNSGNLIGDWIGRQGQGARVWTKYWLSPRNVVQLSYRHQKVSQQFIPAGGTVNDAGAEVELWPRSDFSFATKVQYEKWNFPVLASTAQTNFTTSVEFTYWPGHRRNQ